MLSAFSSQVRSPYRTNLWRLMTLAELHLDVVRAWLANTERRCGPPPAGLLDLAASEGTAGIVASRLEPSDETRAIVHRVFQDGAQALDSLSRLADSLGDLEVVALKGAALIPTVYDGRFSCRPVSDVDLLVRPGQRERIDALGVDLPVLLDVHVNLVDDDRIPTKALLFQLNADQVWKHTLAWRGGVRHLTPELQFIHLALHALKHSCSRLIWLVDLALVLRQCDGSRLQLLARRIGCVRVVVFTLHLLAAFFPAEPMPPRSALRWYERLFLAVARRHAPNLAWGEVFLALAVCGWRHKLRYLWEYACPPGRSDWRRVWRFLTNKRRTRGVA